MSEEIDMRRLIGFLPREELESAAYRYYRLYVETSRQLVNLEKWMEDKGIKDYPSPGEGFS